MTMVATVIASILGGLVVLLMGLRLVTLIGVFTGRLAGDDRFHELSKERDASAAHITVYWHFKTSPERFGELEVEAKRRFIEWTENQPFVPIEAPAMEPALAIAGVPVDVGMADPHTALLNAFQQRLATHLPVQLATFPAPGVIGLTFDHTMVSGLTFARAMAYTFGDPAGKGSRAFPIAWYAPIFSELALAWYLARVAASFRGWEALPSISPKTGVSPETTFYNFNIEALKAEAIAAHPGKAPSSLALIAAQTLRDLLRSMRETLNRPLRVGFSVAFAHSKVLHNNVGLIVIEVPKEGADMSLPELAQVITRTVGAQKLQAWHSNNFLKTIPVLPSKSYRVGVDVVFTAYPSPPGDLFEPEELTGIKAEVRELTYPLYVNCISYLERCFVSMVVNTPAVDREILAQEHAQAASESAHTMAPEDADSYRALLDI